MSITVSILPVLLLSALGVPASFSLAAFEGQGFNRAGADPLKGLSGSYHLDLDESKHMCEKEMETVFVDRETLIKTLLEHGATLMGETDNTISCTLENLVLNFYKKGDNKEAPFILKVSYLEEDILEETMGEINSEYAENAQEISYNLIKERLEEKHLMIENEEVYEDNTIVLTVNLE